MSSNTYINGSDRLRLVYRYLDTVSQYGLNQAVEYSCETPDNQQQNGDSDTTCKNWRIE